MKKIVILICFLLMSCQKADFNVIGGKGYNFASLSDQVIFLNVWADWCAPCIKKIPDFNKLDKHPNAKVFGFHFDQFDILESDEISMLMSRLGIEFENLVSDPRDILDSGIPENVPTLWIVKEGRIIDTIIEPLNYEQLMAKLESHLVTSD